MRKPGRRRLALLVMITTLLSVTGCGQLVSGSGTVANAPDARFPVKGAADDAFDVAAKNALSDITAFWRTTFPTVSDGRRLRPLSGGYYSVDGDRVFRTRHLYPPVTGNACARRNTLFVVDNGAFCILDDSIAWDRSPDHLLARLADRYGTLLTGMIFAHEFGHAVQYQLGLTRHRYLPTRDVESQADCAAGAWAASALAGDAPHFRDTTPARLDAALEGYLNFRDSTPAIGQDISHGDGFDRLSAVADGIRRGARYCYSHGYYAGRSFTERSFFAGEAQQDNTPLADMLVTKDNIFATDLNRYWTGAAKTVGKTFRPVTLRVTATPTCAGDGTTVARIGYCPTDNSVYVDPVFARDVYYSLPTAIAHRDATVTLLHDQPADFALGTLLSIAWGLAARHQLFGGSLGDRAALLSAVCYSGAYARNINKPPGRATTLTLSPADLDEATSAMLDEVDRAEAFGARGTTGLQRISTFVTGYAGGLSAC